MGLVDVCLISEDDDVIAAHIKLAPGVHSVLKMQGAVQLNDELSDAVVALDLISKSWLPARVAISLAEE